MNILAVDTSSATLVASLITDNFNEETVVSDNSLQHSETLMPHILDLCKKAGIQTKELDLLVCTRGPGSFTGLRIAMATLKGIAYGSNAELVSVPTMLTYANTVKDYNGLVVSAIDAKKQRYYLSAYECKNSQVTGLIDDIDGNIENITDVLEKYSSVLVVGPDKEKFASVIKKAYPDKEVVTQNNGISFAQSMIELGKKQFNEKGADDIGQGPAYLRKSDAEVALEEKNKEIK